MGFNSVNSVTSSPVRFPFEIKHPRPMWTFPPTPTYNPRTRHGCLYGGKWYPPETEIVHGSSRERNFCWWLRCDREGRLLTGDNFNCFGTTAIPIARTTLPRIPTRLPPQ